VRSRGYFKTGEKSFLESASMIENERDRRDAPRIALEKSCR